VEKRPTQTQSDEALSTGLLLAKKLIFSLNSPGSLISLTSFKELFVALVTVMTEYLLINENLYYKDSDI
jgi:hypothetical protein